MDAANFREMRARKRISKRSERKIKRAQIQSKKAKASASKKSIKCCQGKNSAFS
jgi:hypothetical protein